MSQDERTIWTFSLIHCIRHNLSFRLRFSHPHYSSSHQRIWQCGIDLKGGREGGGPGLSYLSLSLYVSGNSSWSPLTAVQQGSHGSTSEWLLIEWEMKRTVVVPVQSPPPPSLLLSDTTWFFIWRFSPPRLQKSLSTQRDSLFRCFSMARTKGGEKKDPWRNW